MVRTSRASPPSNKQQTLLGLEFGDEDFSIEEEKTEKADVLDGAISSG